MKFNTQTYEVLGGERNIQLATEAGDPLAEVTEEQAIRLAALKPAERAIAYAEMVAPAEAKPDPAGDDT